MKKLAITTFAIAIAISSTAADARHHGKKHHKPMAERNYYVGDPKIVYHEIGTSGSQNGNTIVPMFREPVRSQKPYEVRYDYQDYRR